MLRITQKELVTKISDKTHYHPDSIQDILKSCGEVIQELLITDPTENMTIDLWEGFKVKRVYEDERKLSGKLQNLECVKKLKIKAHITRFCRDKINKAALGDKK